MNVTVACSNPSASITLLMGEDEPEFSGGYGGFDQIERPKRSPIAQWKAPPARTLSLSLLLDGHSEDRAVDGELFALSRLASNDGLNAPPVVTVSGTGVPGNGLIKWFISELNWTQQALNDAGAPTRVAIELSLIEAVEDEIIERPTRGRVQTYVVKKGDTLSKIAADKLGSGSRWREIIKLNPTYVKGKKKVKRRGPKDLRVGETLRLP